MLDIEELQLIVNENQYRNHILCDYYDTKYWLSEYNDIRDELIDYTNKKAKTLSLSTNCIRYKCLHEDIEPCDYHISRLGLDFYNGYTSQENNALTLLNTVLKTDIEQYQLFFLTIDFAHLLDYTLLISTMESMKKTIVNLLHNPIQRLIQGLVLKYELSWSVYNNLLYNNPHCHLIMKVHKDNVNEVLNFYSNYFLKHLKNPAIDFNVKPITNNFYSYKDITHYICKDVYSYIFHYIDRKGNRDTFKVPLPHIIYILYNLKHFRFLHSYKDLKFKLYYRKGLDINDNSQQTE